MQKAVLSIDFDFFVREELEWDWGHRESDLFLEAIWPIRYSHRNIKRDVDPVVHADFMPDNLRYVLPAKGFLPSRSIQVATAESHAALPKFLTMIGNPKFDLFINMDAHHDMHNEPPPVNCGNWWVPLFDQTDGWSRHVHIFPKWKNPETLGKPVRPIEQMRWDEFHLDNTPFALIEAVFICRSGCWVPPHLDPLFNKMVRLFSRNLCIKPRKLNVKEIRRQRTMIRELIEAAKQRARG